MDMMDRHYDIEAFNMVMRASPGELDLQLPEGSTEGRIPEDLLGGTWWGNGPGLFRIGGRFVHPFDGHGYVRALRFDPRGVRLQARFVKTPAYTRELEENAIRYRGLGTLVDGGWLANVRATGMRNVANTCVLPWGGQVLALWEGGQPYALDAATLDTKGPETFGGALPYKTAFLAHTRIHQGKLIGLTQAMHKMRTQFRFHEIDSSNKVISSREGELDGLSLTHDFLVTPSWYVALEGAITVDPVQYVKARLGLGSIMDAVKQQPRTGRVLLVPRGGGAPKIIDLGHPAFAVHHVNAWEEDGRVVVLTCAFDRVSMGHEFGFQGPFERLDPGVRFPADGQRLMRFDIDPAAGSTTRRQVSSYAIDFPRVHPARDGLYTRYVVGACSRLPGVPDPFDSVALVDLEQGTTAVWSAGPGEFVGEPLFVPRGGASSEGDAWIVVMVYDGGARRSSLCILDAARVEAGPVATLRLPVLLPYGFHGYWQAAA